MSNSSFDERYNFDQFGVIAGVLSDAESDISSRRGSKPAATGSEYQGNQYLNVILPTGAYIYPGPLCFADATLTMGSI